MNILWRLKICLKKKGWNDRLSNAQKLQTDNSATACAITDNQSRYSGIMACPFSVSVVLVACRYIKSPLPADAVRLAGTIVGELFGFVLSSHLSLHKTV